MDIAQLVRALDCGSRGRRFESDYPPHLNIFHIGGYDIIKILGCRQVGKAPDSDSGISEVRVLLAQPKKKEHSWVFFFLWS